ncbi:MAG: helix-hairpin-helix domain-containing protein [Planctomycetaceae bacterium]|jgi:competence ComEA-like helix-hairpin-helix protein|nr:helix-hairpin-helix domain-containing protein [Planctomycetaceae bacterium]
MVEPELNNTDNLRVAKPELLEADNLLLPRMVLYKQDRVVIMFFLTVLFVIFWVIHSGTSWNVDDEIVLDYQFHVDLNNATKAEFQTLPGIGTKLSKNIVIYRDSINRFNDVDDLRNVNLIGQKKLEAIKPFIIINNTDSFSNNTENSSKRNNTNSLSNK